ncbi:MAG: hypothetical protein HKN45_07525 [Flavobacteriales bacterium]|nr:hypothetical protein [Flavobacteriales bacterium]
MNPNRAIEISIQLAFVLLVAIVAFTSGGLLDTGDGIAHYQIARFSWSHPELFLHHWGKPLFTLLSSPFAQIGFNGMITFNLICAALTGYYLLKLSKSFSIERAWVALLCLFCTPIYYHVVLGGMTEVAFALFLTAGLYYLLNGQMAMGAIILSFLPYLRPEAYIIIPIYGLFILVKDYKLLPLFLTGTLIYSLAGLIAFEDFFWYLTQDPYSNKDPSFYGSGSPWRFIYQTKNINGLVLAFFFLVGSIWKVKDTLSIGERSQQYFWWFIFIPVLAVYIVHSILWWKGLKGSAGLIRVIASVAPLIALVSAIGIERVIGMFVSKRHKLLIGAFCSLLVIIVFVDRVDFRIKFKEKEKLAVEAAQWTRENYPEMKIFYLEPLVSFSIDLDPYDETISSKLWHLDREVPSKSANSGDLILWDSHYGPVEASLPLESLQNDEDLEFIRTFLPEPPILIFGNRYYELHLFRKK